MKNILVCLFALVLMALPSSAQNLDNKESLKLSRFSVGTTVATKRGSGNLGFRPVLDKSVGVLSYDVYRTEVKWGVDVSAGTALSVVNGKLNKASLDPQLNFSKWNLVVGGIYSQSAKKANWFVGVRL